MKKLLISTFVLAILALTSTQIVNAKDSCGITKQERTIESFNSIKISGVFNVIITQGDTEAVTVEAKESRMDDIITEVKDNKLYIKLKSKKNKNCATIKVYVTIKDINELYHNGVGNVKSNGDLKLQNLNLHNNGVGNVDLTGTVDVLNIQNSGVGNVKVEGLIAKKVDLQNSGVGSVDVYADEELKINNSGVGTVTYRGECKITDLNTSGVGKIKKK